MLIPTLAVALGGFCCLYTFIINIFRHTTYEYISIWKSLEDLLQSSFIFWLSWRVYSYPSQIASFFTLLSSLLKIHLAYLNYVRGKEFPRVNCEGKVYVITGSSAGIGVETAREIARMDGTVILACRSKDKARATAQDIIKTTHCSPSKVIVLTLDVSDLNSVRNFVKEFHQLGFPLHGLINNAGVMLPERSVNSAGHEMMFASNHLGHFLLTLLLLDDLEKTGGRVVNVSSSLHRSVSSSIGFNFNDLMAQQNYSLFGTYAQTKLANVIFTIELNRRLRAKDSKVTVFAVHPGAVLTDVTRSLPYLIRLAHTIFTPFMLLLQKLPSQGAYCQIYAATSPDLSVRESGAYLFHCEKAIHNPIADDPTTGAKLWEISEELCGISSKK